METSATLTCSKLRLVLDIPLHHSRVDGPNGVRISDHDRAIKCSSLLDPVTSGELSISVVTIKTRRTRSSKFIAFPTGENRGHSGPDRTFSNLKRAVAADKCRISDFQADNIRNRVQGSGGPRKLKVVPRALLVVGHRCFR